MEQAIEATGLVKRYPKGVTALDGLSFGVEGGTIFGLLGPHGAGKSTTVKILTTLAEPDEGTAHVMGPMWSPSEPRCGGRSGSSPRDPGSTCRRPTREVRLQGQLYGMRGRQLEQRRRACSSGSVWRMPLTASRKTTRVACSAVDIAMALVHAPQVLFLDEPTTGLTQRCARRCGGRSPGSRTSRESRCC